MVLGQVTRASQRAHLSVFWVQTRQNPWSTDKLPTTPMVPGKINKTHKCPRDMFWEDLVEEVSKAQAEGGQVLIMLDINKDMKGLTTKQKIKTMGLVEAITTLHKSKPPPTHQRGQDPIDGIFLSPSLLEGTQGGYLEFDSRLGSDHRGLWLNIPKVALFGDTLNIYILAKARQLQCKDPQIVTKYNDALYNILQSKQIFQRAHNLQISTINRFSDSQQNANMRHWTKKSKQN